MVKIMKGGEKVIIIPGLLTFLLNLDGSKKAGPAKALPRSAKLFPKAQVLLFFRKRRRTMASVPELKPCSTRAVLSATSRSTLLSIGG